MKLVIKFVRWMITIAIILVIIKFINSSTLTFNINTIYFAILGSIGVVAIENFIVPMLKKIY